MGIPRLRVLAWRRIRDPWLVLVSEVMLQQTQARRAAMTLRPGKLRSAPPPTIVVR